MKRVLCNIVLIILCFVLQSTLFQALSFNGIVPNLLIILCASIGFMNGELSGMLVGFACGLLVDIFYSDLLGLYAMLYMYIGYINGKFNAIFYPEDIKLPLALIFLSDLSYAFLCYVLTFLLRSRFNISFYFMHIILPESIYTILITILFYPLFLALHNLLTKSEQRSARKFV